MTTVLLIGILSIAVALPHRLRPEAPPPVLGIVLWTGALVLRAITTTLLMACGLALAASSEYAQDVVHLVWHSNLPAIAGNTGADEHTVIDALVLLPALALGVVVAHGVLRSARLARKLRSVVDRTQLSHGPAGSVVVAERLPLVAAIGLFRARVVVSASTLSLLDSEELAVAIAHERAHIAHGHRFVLFLAGVCATVSRWQPGTSGATRELCHELERDADRVAVNDGGERLALATAICKVAMGRRPATASAAQFLHGSSIVARVRELTVEPEPSPQAGIQAAGLAGGIVCAILVGLAFQIHIASDLGEAVRILVHHPAD